MPRVNVTITPASGTGIGAEITKTSGDAANDHKVSNRLGSRVLVFVENGDVGPHEATVVHVEQPVDADDIVTSVPAGKTYVFGPLPAALYTQPSGDDVNYVQVNLDVATGVKLYAISF